MSRTIESSFHIEFEKFIIRFLQAWKYEVIVKWVRIQEDLSDTPLKSIEFFKNIVEFW